MVIMSERKWDERNQEWTDWEYECDCEPNPDCGCAHEGEYSGCYCYEQCNHMEQAWQVE